MKLFHVTAKLPGHIRPVYNGEPNTDVHPFGKPRPMKHYRKGYLNDSNASRFVPSVHTISDIQDKPAGWSISAANDPDKCNAVHIENAVQSSTSIACHEEKTAKQRVKGASTNLRRNYYTSLQSYRESKCKTFKQNDFHFVDESLGHPSDFRSQCSNKKYIYNAIGNNVDIEAEKTNCNITTHKRNNDLFYTQGSVTSSDYIARKKYNEGLHHKQNVRNHFITYLPSINR